jgi:5-(carboxyamino)imidazole ribonucleotide synthase
MKHPFKPVIGIIGGGQLGKMLIESSAPWNLKYNVLDPDNDAPCKTYANKFIHASLTDDKAIRELSSISDILTYEIEHINSDTLLDLEKSGKVIIPSPRILRIIQVMMEKE